jgi:hypothetical protein
MDSITVAEAEILQAELAKQITQLAQTFEATTGLSIHSIPIQHQDKKPHTATVQVKVQLMR